MKKVLLPQGIVTLFVFLLSCACMRARAYMCVCFCDLMSFPLGAMDWHLV